MSENKPDIATGWVDPDDAPEWTDDQFERAELRVDERIVRPAGGTLTRTGRPSLGAAAKQQVTLRLDPDVVAKFRAQGPGWQSRINAALRSHIGI